MSVKWREDQTVGNTGLTVGQFAAKITLHGITGGVLAELQGGKFGHGFLSAGIPQALSPAIGKIPGGPTGRVVVAALVGGTISEATGGKFANGAITAAFARAFNDELGDFLEKRTALMERISLLGKAMQLNLEDWNTLFPKYQAQDDNTLLLEQAMFNQEYTELMFAETRKLLVDAVEAVIDSYEDKATAYAGGGLAAAIYVAAARAPTLEGVAKVTVSTIAVIEFSQQFDFQDLRELARAIRITPEISRDWRQYWKEADSQ